MRRSVDLEFHWVPDPGEVPPVSDMSSGFLSRPVDEGRCGLIYAGAQNVGPVWTSGSVGGMRASICNAMPIERVQTGVDYLAEFAARKG